MKKIVALLMIAVMTFSLAACGKTTDNTKTPPETTNAKFKAGTYEGFWR